VKIRPLLALTAALALTGCVQSPTPTPTTTVTVTTIATPTITPSGAPTDDESDSVQSEPTFELWREAVWAFEKSEEAGKPITQRYSALIKNVTYEDRGAGILTATLDRVTWNPKYTDSVDTPDPVLNPVVKWETVRFRDVMVLVDAGNGFRKVELSDFPDYVKKSVAQSTQADGWMMPFSVYCVGNEPVALVEWYVP
jgi:hypothetical protein